MQDNSSTGAGRARLAQEHQLRSIGPHPVLDAPQGPVLLNAAAADILTLCDGSRTAAEIVTGAVGSAHEELAGDVLAFLDAARRRGWINLE
jgi:hypothetical protein